MACMKIIWLYCLQIFKLCMMKFLVSILLTVLLCFASGLYLQWWGFAIGAFIASLAIPQGSGRSFLGAFLAVFMLWGLLAWWIDSQNNSILSQKIARVLPLGGSVFSLVLLTAFIGALVAGFAALTASYLKKSIQAAKEA